MSDVMIIAATQDQTSVAMMMREVLRLDDTAISLQITEGKRCIFVDRWGIQSSSSSSSFKLAFCSGCDEQIPRRMMTLETVKLGSVSVGLLHCVV